MTPEGRTTEINNISGSLVSMFMNLVRIELACVSAITEKVMNWAVPVTENES